MAKFETTASRDVSVIFIGKKALKKDRTFGTNLVFRPGQVHLLVAAVAQNFLNCPDVYTTEGTPELAAFIKRDPINAAKFGWIELTEDESNTLQEKQDVLDAAAAKAEKERLEWVEQESIVIEPNPLDEGAGDNTLLLDDAKAELAALPNKDALQVWANDNELDIKLTGTRDEMTEQALAQYAQSLNQVEDKG